MEDKSKENVYEKPANEGYWLSVGKKILETFISVKVWTISTVFIVSVIMVYDGVLAGGSFATLNASIISVVYALREGFKTTRLREEEEYHRGSPHRREKNRPKRKFFT